MSDEPADRPLPDPTSPLVQADMPGPAKAARWQFSLRDILLLFFVVSSVLALTVQLDVLGGVLACYLAALAVGLRLQHRGLASGAATACAVFVLAIGASWVRLGYASLADGGATAEEQRWLEQIAAALADYREQHGEYPETLDDRFQSASGIGLGPPRRRIYDFSLRYRRTPSGYELVSLGSDGQPGGQGYNADIRPYESLLTPHHRLSFEQFLFNDQNYGSVLTPALLASLLAGQIVFSTTPQKGPPPTSFFRIATVAVASVAVAVLLASFYLNQPRSGH